MRRFLAHSLALTISVSPSLPLVLFERLSPALPRIQVIAVVGAHIQDTRSHFSQARRREGALGGGALPDNLHMGEAREGWLVGVQEALCADSLLSHRGRPCWLLALAPLCCICTSSSGSGWLDFFFFWKSLHLLCLLSGKEICLHLLR